MNIIIRHDDFDFRLQPQVYIENHEKFIKANLIETAVIQVTQDGRLPNIDPYLVSYMKKSTHWNIQLHGWDHLEYDKMPYDQIIKDLGAAIQWIETVFEKRPYIWFPPWNRRNETMEKAASFFNLIIDNESNDIRKFIRDMEAGSFDGHSVYFHLWNGSEAELVDRMIELCK